MYLVEDKVNAVRYEALKFDNDMISHRLRM